MALLTVPAHAGSWDAVGIEYNGKSSGSAGWGHAGNQMDWEYGGWSGDDDITQGAATSNLAPAETQNGSSAGNYIAVLKWRPSTPTEKIPAFVFLGIKQTVQGYGGRRDMTNWPSADFPASGSAGSVELSTKVTAPDGTSVSDSAHVTQNAYGYNYSSESTHPTMFATISTQGATLQNGVYTVRYPLPAVSATFKVKAGSYVVENDPGVYDPCTDGAWANLVITPTIGQPATLTYSPSPDNIALDDGSGKIPNRYLITNGIPTSVSATSVSTGFGEWLRGHSNWALSSPSPTLRPILLPHSLEDNNGTVTVRPRHPAIPRLAHAHT